MPLDRYELGRRLKAAREACGLTQQRVARYLGVSRSTIAQMELGKRAVTSLELDKLANLYGRDIREFLADDFREQGPIAAFFREHTELCDLDALIETVRKVLAIGREMVALERALGIAGNEIPLPSYPLPSPRTRWEAVRQGEWVAAEERRRIGLGDAPLPDMAELLHSQSVRALLFSLPPTVSGLTLVDDEAGVFVVVNSSLPKNSGTRRRFSLAHEYCHALLDRDQKGVISRPRQRHTLLEVRANAFAASFLMPQTAVESFLRRLGKGRPVRQEIDLYDEEGVLRVFGHGRRAGIQRVQMYDVVLMAHHFGVSRQAAIYRLKNCGLISDREFKELKHLEEQGKGKALGRLLGLRGQEDQLAGDELRRYLLALALEAFRREEISQRKLMELAAMVGVSERDVRSLLCRSGLDPSEGPVDVLLPEG